MWPDRYPGRMPRPEELLFPTRKERFEDRRKEREHRKLAGEFFDHPTLLAVSRLISQGQFESLEFPISTGKEGGVFRATGPGGFRAVKVYRIGNAIFRRLPPHALEDLRREASVRNYARLVYAWTRREYTTLGRLYDAHVRVPQPYGFLRNVLVMEFIGVGGLPCPRVRDAVIPDPTVFYADLTEQMHRMTVEAKLVHGDLSPYNVLLGEDGRAVLIDVASSVATDHPQAAGLLRRDTAHFARFLKKLGIDTSPEELFARAGGNELPHGG